MQILQFQHQRIKIRIQIQLGNIILRFHINNNNNKLRFSINSTHKQECQRVSRNVPLTNLTVNPRLNKILRIQHINIKEKSKIHSQKYP